ncbi:PQQ-dependent dehydrogenase, methanol/ethanol family [Luteitalea sp.]
MGGTPRRGVRRHVAPALLAAGVAAAVWAGATLTAGRGPVAPTQEAKADVPWAMYGLDAAETHYSPLTQITTANVARLGLVWSAELDAFPGQIQGSPIVVDGTMYTTGPWSVVVAVDARTGKVKWRWDPQIPHPTFKTDARGLRTRLGPSLCCGPVNRGVAYHDGKVYVGTLDSRLVALDARTGRTVWSTQVMSKADDYSITSAPRIIKGKVITGSSGSEFGVRGFLAAYDAQTGKQVWRFWTVPGDPSLGFENAALERAAKTWNGAWWKYGGGGTPWDGMAYDPELDLLYIGTGNGSPWSRELRSPGGGDNLYLCSILAIRPDTGEYVWHYQTTPADNWDYASTQPIVLADLKIDGRVRKVLMQAPKNGFFYVLDRATGAFISAQPFTDVTWASGIDQKTGRPIETPEASYGTTGQRLSPGSDGAHSWHAMAWHPGAGLAYIPGQHTTGTFAWDPDFQHQMGRMNTGRPRNRPAPVDAATHPGGAAAPAAAAPATPTAPVRRGPQIVGAGGGQQQGAFLVAWDPLTQKERWRLTFAQPGITGGTLATAGNLLFHGSNDGTFSAYTADTGQRLWSVMLAPGFANPVTYTIGGVQYVTVATGRSGTQAPGRLYTFAVDARGTVPSMAPIPPPEDPSGINTAAAIQAEFDRVGLPDDPARTLVQQLCSGCHQPTVVTRMRQPEDGWRETIANMASRGMPGTPEQREQIIRYLARHRGPEGARPPAP